MGAAWRADTSDARRVATLAKVSGAALRAHFRFGIDVPVPLTSTFSCARRSAPAGSMPAANVVVIGPRAEAFAIITVVAVDAIGAVWDVKVTSGVALNACAFAVGVAPSGACAVTGANVAPSAWAFVHTRGAKVAGVARGACFSDPETAKRVLVAFACDGRGACTVLFALSVARLRLRALLVAPEAVPILFTHAACITGPEPGYQIACASACAVVETDTPE